MNRKDKAALLKAAGMVDEGKCQFSCFAINTAVSGDPLSDTDLSDSYRLFYTDENDLTFAQSISTIYLFDPDINYEYAKRMIQLAVEIRSFRVMLLLLYREAGE